MAGSRLDGLPEAQKGDPDFAWAALIGGGVGVLGGLIMSLSTLRGLYQPACCFIDQAGFGVLFFGGIVAVVAGAPWAIFGALELRHTRYARFYLHPTGVGIDFGYRRLNIGAGSLILRY